MDLPDLTPLERRTEELLARATKFNEELVRLRESLHHLEGKQESASPQERSSATNADG